MQQSLPLTIVSFVVLLAMAATFFFFYMKSLAGETEAYWLLILAKLRERLDKIPNLIETVRQFSPADEKTIQELIKLRDLAWTMERSTHHLVQNQLNITDALHKFWALPQKFPALGKDTNFLALKMEFKQINEDIEILLERHNASVRHYNKHLSFVIFIPLVAVFRLKREQIFEFEA